MMMRLISGFLMVRLWFSYVFPGDEDHTDSWTGLLPEILNKIADLLLYYLDYFSLLCTCGTYSRLIRRRPDKCPWLVLPCLTIYPGTTVVKSSHRTLHNIAENSGVAIRYGWDIGMFYTWWGSRYGWIILVHNYKNDIKLLNPLTRAQVDLPRDFPNETEVVYYARKAVLDGDPSSRDDCTVMILQHGNPSTLFFKFGDESWQPVRNSESGRFTDIICVNNVFYSIDMECNLYRCNLPDDPCWHRVAVDAPMTVRELSEMEFMRLIELHDDILLVCKNIQPEGLMFSLHRFSVDESVWVRVADLGEYVVFLSENGSMCYQASEEDYYQKNSVYFVHEEVDWGQTLYGQGPLHYELGVFRLEDGTLQLSRFPNSFVVGAVNTSYSPLWVTLDSRGPIVHAAAAGLESMSSTTKPRDH